MTQPFLIQGGSRFNRERDSFVANINVGDNLKEVFNQCFLSSPLSGF